MHFPHPRIVTEFCNSLLFSFTKAVLHSGLFSFCGNMIYKLIILISVHFCNCEWVEIPQSSISSTIEKTPRKSDVNLFYAFTTSTTEQSPILVKPAVINIKSNRRKSNHNNNRDFENNKRNKINNKLIQQAQDRTTTKSNKIRVVNNVSNIRVHNQGRISNSFPDVDDWEDGHIEDKDIEEMDYGVHNTFNTSEEFTNNEEEEEEQEEEQQQPQDNGYSYASFVPYLTKIQSTLMRNAHNNRKSKLSILTNLRDNLLYQLENRINSIWTPKSSDTKARGDSSGWSDSGVDFPSNEAALMTIGFLTFGVFLIKLVLKCIQAISNNGTTTTNTVFLGRSRRNAFDSDSIKILNLIDEYSFK